MGFEFKPPSAKGDLNSNPLSAKGDLNSNPLSAKGGLNPSPLWPKGVLIQTPFGQRGVEFKPSSGGLVFKPFRADFSVPTNLPEDFASIEAGSMA